MYVIHVILRYSSYNVHLLFDRSEFLVIFKLYCLNVIMRAMCNRADYLFIDYFNLSRFGWYYYITFKFNKLNRYYKVEAVEFEISHQRVTLVIAYDMTP